MKKIYVKVATQLHAKMEIRELKQILDESTPIKTKVDITRNELKTQKVIVKFFPFGSRQTDGLRCDIPCRFGDYGKVIAREEKFEKLETMKDIAKYIVEEEL